MRLYARLLSRESKRSGGLTRLLLWMTSRSSSAQQARAIGLTLPMPCAGQLLVPPRVTAAGADHAAYGSVRAGRTTATGALYLPPLEPGEEVDGGAKRPTSAPPAAAPRVISAVPA